MNTITHKTFGAALLLSVLVLAGCDLPPQEVVQRGYRGTGMEQVINPGNFAASVEENQAPVASPMVPSPAEEVG